MILGDEQTFGAGDDTFANRGTVSLRSPGASTILGLERFENGGVVNLLGGGAGDVLGMAGVFHGASGSRLRIDAGDVLRVDSATGQTMVEVSGSRPVLGMERVVFAMADGESDAGAFRADLNRVKGFVGFDVAYGAPGKTWSLGAVLNDRAWRPAALAGSAAHAWRVGADSWADRQATLRTNASGHANGVWIQAYGADADHGTTATSTFGTRELAWHGSSTGVQLGIDRDVGALRVGATAGLGDTRLEFTDGGESRLDATSFGVYASVQQEALFADALLHGSWLSGKHEWSGIGLEQRGDGGTLGLLVDGGTRFGDADRWLEVSARVDATRTSFDDMVTLHGRIVDIAGRELDASVALRGGLRLAGLDWSAHVVAGRATPRDARHALVIDGPTAVIAQPGADSVGIETTESINYGRAGLGVSRRVGRFDCSFNGSYGAGDREDGWRAGVTVGYGL